MEHYYNSDNIFSGAQKGGKDPEGKGCLVPSGRREWPETGARSGQLGPPAPPDHKEEMGGREVLGHGVTAGTPAHLEVREVSAVKTSPSSSSAAPPSTWLSIYLWSFSGGGWRYGPFSGGKDA
jgi:hypothetical protein